MTLPQAQRPRQQVLEIPVCLQRMTNRDGVHVCTLLAHGAGVKHTSASGRQW